MSENQNENASDLHLSPNTVTELEAGMEGHTPAAATEPGAPRLASETWDQRIGTTELEAGTEGHTLSQDLSFRPERSEVEKPTSAAAAERRIGTIDRATTETQIKLTLNLDGQGTYHVSTGIRFFDHMLELFTRHGGFDLDLQCTGDLDVDQHHTVEDVGIALGEAFDKALGDKKGILRAGYFVMAMDETLAVAAVDMSGRVGYAVDDKVDVPIVGDLQTELVTDFFDGFARGGRCNVHVKTMYGRSNHHKIEAIFKAFARALRGAVSRDERMKDLLPSTKGLL